MSVRQSPGRHVYGASIVLGVLAIAELIFLLLPKFRPLTNLFDLIELFIGRISPSLKGIIGNSSLLQTTIAFALIWLAAWAALEAFSRLTDGLSLWRNISHDSCGKVRDGVRRLACTSYKWMLTVAAAPVLIVWALAHRLRHGYRIVTVGFVTIDPAAVIGYIKHIALGLALLLSLILLFGGGASQEVGTGLAR